MRAFIFIITFILGACVGSFLNVAIDSLPQGKPFLWRRSRCDHCKKPLGFLDLVPVLSFLCLGGRCRYCHKKISWQYPLVEIAVGVLFVLSLGEMGLISPTSLISLMGRFFIVSLLASIFVIDLKYGVIPDILVGLGIASSLVFMFFDRFEMADLIGALAAGAFFWFLRLITKGKGMGEGDVPLAIFVGLVTGFPRMLVSFSFAFLTGALAGSILILVRKKTLKSTIPFGPFLVIGTFVGMWLGDWFLRQLPFVLLR